MTTPKNTKVELEVHISESGGYWALRVESHNPKSAVRIFKNLHKKYCPNDMEKTEEKPRKIIGYL
jgi:hypothetical protein